MKALTQQYCIEKQFLTFYSEAVCLAKPNGMMSGWLLSSNYCTVFWVLEYIKYCNQQSFSVPVRLSVEGERDIGSSRLLRGAPSCSQMTRTGSGGPWATQCKLSPTFAMTDICWGSTEKWGRPGGIGTDRKSGLLYIIYFMRKSKPNMLPSL